jgi:transcriptional regulator with GAF, ATPase, and Fis domain
MGVNNAIISILRLEDLFRDIADKLKEILKFDVSAITLYDKESDKLIMTAFGGLMGSDKLAPGSELPVTDSHAVWVFTNKNTVVVNDLSQTKRFRFDELMYNEGILSYVVTPLISPKNILGTLNHGSISKNTFIITLFFIIESVIIRKDRQNALLNFMKSLRIKLSSS